MVEATRTRILQRLDGDEIDGHRYVPASVENTMWGRLPVASDRAIATILPGQTITVDTISHEGLLPDQGSDPEAYFGRYGIAPADVLDDARQIPRCKTRDGSRDGSHVVTGPIAVNGARPGDVLMVEVNRLERRVPYGVISTRHGRGVMAGFAFEGNYGALCIVLERDGKAYGQLVPDCMQVDDPQLPECGYPRFALHPFLGIMGVAPDLPERPCSIPPYAFGGNIDVKDMTAGSVLFLPVQAEDAKLFVGDPHFAQGDGEVSLTALEASLRATLTVNVIPAAVADGLFGPRIAPFAYAHGRLLALGLDEDLDAALRHSVDYAVGLLHHLFGIPERALYLYLSAAVDFDISQAVDLVKGVHARIPLDDFSHLLPGKTADGFMTLIRNGIGIATTH